MQTKLTIQEASKATGKHADTIRRLIKANPSSKNITKTKRGYMIEKDWLLNQYRQPAETVAPISEKAKQAPLHDYVPLSQDLAVINALTAQLDAKDKQLADAFEIIKEKESNTTKLQDQFQQLLAVKQLPEASEAEVVKPTKESETKPAKPTKRGGNSAKPKPKTVKKKTTATRKASSGNKPNRNKTTKPTPPKKRRWFGR